MTVHGRPMASQSWPSEAEVGQRWPWPVLAGQGWPMQPKAGHRLLWPALAGQSLSNQPKKVPTLALANQCWPKLAQRPMLANAGIGHATLIGQSWPMQPKVGHRLLWPNLAGQSLPSHAKAGQRWLWPTLAGQGWPREANVGQRWHWPALAEAHVGCVELCVEFGCVECVWNFI